MKYRNLLGKKTKTKIIVFESDDWGSFRFKNKYIRDKFIKNFNPHLWMHNYDTFESANDLQNLFDTLKAIKGKDDKNPKFTFLMNPSNPDFKKIKESNFQNFYNETFLETLDNRNDGKEIFDLYNTALENKMIEIGFHGREHLNVNQWMNDLKNNDKIAHLGFENKVWGFSGLFVPNAMKSYRSTFDINSYHEIKKLKNNIAEGISIINKTFNQKTTYFLPPDGPYHLSLNSELVHNGIDYIGLSKLHNNPLEPQWYHKKLFWIGKTTKEGLTVITRNVIFEPSSPRHNDPINFALKQITDAFKHNKPAVISSHRANFVGSLNSQQRDISLKLLSDLICKIIKIWPEVEFMTSSELGVLLKNS
ncbi:hypothetical protein K8354_09730 [Polaribacter litorisediminis]|uniref:hypothetical protein n=1 Tax=Polaribacter litorisediminis TaxID=1908341 RepID=UPI001CBB542B|nr:hypothetical protein [Polaribacter litorisediminis]UAM96622.1 hypothetical protein K8354_09730 [Polaribacter litorisediminis]